MTLALVLALVLIGVIALLVVLWALFAMVFRALKRRANIVRERFPQATLVVPGANFFGQESHGKAQVRGNGTLVLTGDELYFEKLVPRREIHIPLSSIHAVETPKSHLGKTVGRRLLKVVFRNDSGKVDSIAWYVPDLENVKLTLEAALD